MGFFTDFLSILMNLGLLIVFFSTMFAIEASHPYDREAKGEVKMPLDQNREFIFTLFLLFSAPYFVFLCYFSLNFEWKEMLVSLVNFCIWFWYPLICIDPSNSNAADLIKNNWTQKPARHATEGWDIVLQGFYTKDPQTGTMHEEITDQNLDREFIIELRAKDKWHYKMNLFSYLKVDLDRIAEIRSFKGGLEGILKNCLRFFISLAQKIDDEFDLAGLDYDTAIREEFEKKMREAFKKCINESKFPIEVDDSHDESVAITVLFPDNYEAAKQKSVNEIEEQKKNQITVDRKREMIVALIEEYAKKGITLTREEAREEVELSINPNSVSKNIFDTKGGRTNVTALIDVNK